MTSFVTHLEAAIDGTHLSADQPRSLHNDRPLWVRYDLERVGRALTKEMLAAREPTLWRYRELLPPADDRSIVSLGEGMSPMLPARRLGEELGLPSWSCLTASRTTSGTRSHLER